MKSSTNSDYFDSEYLYPFQTHDFPLPLSLQRLRSYSGSINDCSIDMNSTSLFDIFDRKLSIPNMEQTVSDEPYPFQPLLSTNSDWVPSENARKRQRCVAVDIPLDVGSFFHHEGPVPSHGCTSFAKPTNTASYYIAERPSFQPKKKPSIAQPRPRITVPRNGIGPIAFPAANDVLSGRGGRINAHPGNQTFREFVAERKADYLADTTKKLEKAYIAAQVVERVRQMNPPGRFLKQDPNSHMWWDIGDARAFKKAGQALREDSLEIRQQNSNAGN